MKLSRTHIAAAASFVLAAATAAAFAEEPRLPAGHPQIPAAAKPVLPAGHPMLPSTQPAATSGSITVHAYQGTKGGPAIGGEKVTVELYHRGALLQAVEGKLDATGNTIISDLPLSLPFQPLIRVSHAGVDYSAIGNPMDTSHAGQKVELAVFETTEQAPAWTIQMLHLMVMPAEDGVHVVQMLQVQNPSDKAWVGDKVGDKRVTLALSLPAGATDIEVGGALRDGCDQTPDGKLVNRLALSPGDSMMQVNYVLPLKDGQANLNLTAPWTTSQVMVVVPDGTGVTAGGVESAGVQAMGKTRVQLFKAANLKAGDQITLTLTPGQAPTKKPQALAPQTSNTPKVIAGVGGGLLLVGGTAFVFLKPAKTAK